MRIRVVYRLALACFCFGVAIGTLLADHLSRPVMLGIDVVIAIVAIAIIVDTLNNLPFEWKKSPDEIN